MTTLKGPGEARTYDGSSLRIGIIHARWNTKIIDALLDGTKKALKAAGVKNENIVLQSVPGSYELPYAVKQYVLPQDFLFCLSISSPRRRQEVRPRCADLTRHRLYAASQAEASSSTVIGGAADLLGSVSDLSIEPTKPTSSTLSTPFDAIIAIGVLIKGETMHFEYIADAVSHGLMRVQLENNVPLIFGLLTLLSDEQGLQRAGIGGATGSEGHNHGEDWGSAAVELGVKRKGWVEGKYID
ncbi:6,7-dimethyl-8-ribityllumazine synthase [Paraphaeosphaeria minitans]|uniref:6,7-dimethyl-8-ribityllumazine synthase n=1 Tax=Paraphaeosphaeria minitans TaxID=565426 RepID=A0A9P6G7G6_9PLEO|nr:6,7-dimethyl-8-ribityllumazine synthase [Paraphaeosphaeria minitans]